MTKYTLDRIENSQFVFVEKGNEINEVIIAKEFVPFDIAEGDIVNITGSGVEYTFEKLKEEQQTRKEDVQSLIEKLKNKK